MAGDKPIPAKVGSGGSSGEATLFDAMEPIDSGLRKMADPTSQVVKKAPMA